MIQRTCAVGRCCWPIVTPRERSTIHRWRMTPPQAAVYVGQPLRKTDILQELDHSRTAGRVEVEILRRASRRKQESPSAPWAGSVPTAASTCCLSWRGERSSGRRSNVSTFQRSNVQRLAPPAGCAGCGKRVANRRIVLQSAIPEGHAVRNPQSSHFLPTFPHFQNSTLLA